MAARKGAWARRRKYGLHVGGLSRPDGDDTFWPGKSSENGLQIYKIIKDECSSLSFAGSDDGSLVGRDRGASGCEDKVAMMPPARVGQGSSGRSRPSPLLLLRSSSAPLFSVPFLLLGLSFSSVTPPRPSLPFLRPFCSSARKAPMKARLQRDEDLATVVPVARELGIRPKNGGTAASGFSPK